MRNKSAVIIPYGMSKVIWFLLFLVGCGGSTPLSFQLGSEYTSQERAMIEEAAEEWNNVTYESRHIDFNGDGSGWVMHKAPIDSLIDGNENGQAIVTRADLSTETLRATVAHELGHVLGIQHTCAPARLLSTEPSCEPGVMYPAVVAARWQLTATDLDACRAARACP